MDFSISIPELIYSETTYEVCIGYNEFNFKFRAIVFSNKANYHITKLYSINRYSDEYMKLKNSEKKKLKKIASEKIIETHKTS